MYVFTNMGRNYCEHSRSSKLRTDCLINFVHEIARKLLKSYTISGNSHHVIVLDSILCVVVIPKWVANILADCILHCLE